MAGKLRIKNLGLEINQSGGWSEINHRLEVPEKLRRQVLYDDKYVCQSCGLDGSDDTGRYLEVHHLNGNHTDNSKKNLATICPHCHMCFHLDFAGKNRQADLIFLPEITQVELFHLYRIKEVWKYQLSIEDERKTNAKKSPLGTRRGVKPKQPEPETEKKAEVEDDGIPRNVGDTLEVVDNFLSDRSKTLSSIFQTSSPSEFAGAMRQQLRTDKDENLETQRKGMRHIRLLPQDSYVSVKGNNVWPDMVKSWLKYYKQPKFWRESSEKLFKDAQVPNIASLINNNRPID